ncbi:MAG: hypothetical protein M2R45_03225 [Verrucomicrobia subdivision 3 bacterium]|nr:hypothetical protein [Limisphaerales bacterium]MCS1416086.1 hypothetical protein [Limisphaerales bacterium]
MVSFSKRYLFLAIPVIAFTVFFILPKSRSLFQSKETREAIAKYEAHREETLATWQNANYVTIEHSGAFESKVKETVQQHKAAGSLTTGQRQALATAITQLIYAHHDGTWESYRDFRMPIGIEHIRFNERVFGDEPLSAFADRLREEGVANSPIELFEAVWKKWGNNSEPPPAGFEKMRRYCVQCWKSVGLESLQLTVGAIKGKWPSFNNYVTTNRLGGGGVFGGRGFSSSLTFSPTPDELIKSRSSVKIIFITLLISTDNLDKNYPVSVSFYWSPQHRKWLPNEFAVGFVNSSLDYIF